MGILLVLFVIAEITLLVITFTKQKGKQEWLKNCLVTRISEMTIYLVVLLLPQVAWDFRFKLWL